MRTSIVLAAVVLAACQTPQPIAPPVDASDAMPAPVTTTQPIDQAATACAHLRDLKCPLGSDPKCETVFRLPTKFKANPTCVLGATTVAGLLPCNVTCQP
jgi:hypothetical protein